MQLHEVEKMKSASTTSDANQHLSGAGAGDGCSRTVVLTEQAERFRQALASSRQVTAAVEQVKRGARRRVAQPRYE